MKVSDLAPANNVGGRSCATPAGVVLLAAGRGSRLASLTNATHKSLLPIGGRPALAYTIEALVSRNVLDIVTVTGDKCEVVEQFVREGWGSRVTVVRNQRFAEDTNVLSTEIGVAALRDPGAGYLIVETDLVIEPSGWSTILDVGDGRESIWVTRGRYSESLTGGALCADEEGRVRSLVYAPQYSAAYDGWQKLLGLLYVGSDQVPVDRDLRRRAIAHTIAQYYMTPWVEHLSSLPCRAKNLEDTFAASYNDLESYRRANLQFASILSAPRRSS